MSKGRGRDERRGTEAVGDRVSCGRSRGQRQIGRRGKEVKDGGV